MQRGRKKGRKAPASDPVPGRKYSREKRGGKIEAYETESENLISGCLILAGCAGSGSGAGTTSGTETKAAETAAGAETKAGESAAGAEASSADNAVAKTSDYPKENITMIIPYGAGGTTDLVGRQLAIALEKQLGQTIIVENKAGASGSVGTEAALEAKPDGYTLLLTADSLGTQRVMGISEMSYGDFSPILPIANDPKVMVVAKDSPYETIQDLLDAMKENPGKIKMSYTGPGGSGHIQALLLNRYGYEPALTAYNSGAEGITAVMGHQVDFTNSNYSTVASYIESGDLKLLAVCSVEPLSAHPDVVTLASVMPGSEEMMAMPYTPLSLIVRKDVPEDIKETAVPVLAHRLVPLHTYAAVQDTKEIVADILHSAQVPTERF